MFLLDLNLVSIVQDNGLTGARSTRAGYDLRRFATAVRSSTSLCSACGRAGCSRRSGPCGRRRVYWLSCRLARPLPDSPTCSGRSHSSAGRTAASSTRTAAASGRSSSWRLSHRSAGGACIRPVPFPVRRTAGNMAGRDRRRRRRSRDRSRWASFSEMQAQVLNEAEEVNVEDLPEFWLRVRFFKSYLITSWKYLSWLLALFSS